MGLVKHRPEAHVAHNFSVDTVDERPGRSVRKLFEIHFVSGEPLDHTPGQFVELSVMGIGEGPISISSPPRGTNSFELAIRRVGNLTNAVHLLKAGDKVVVDPASWCGECEQCRIGRENTCYNLRFLGTPGQGGGCLCEYIVMPEKSCLVINDKISLEQAALCEPFAIGVYSVQQAQMQKNAKIASDLLS